MPTSLLIETFEPLAWINEYTHSIPPISATEFAPILQFSLMWSLFERDACNKRANTGSIKSAVEKSFSEGKLLIETFQDHIQYFKDRANNNEMTVSKYLVALKMDKESIELVDRFLSGKLSDANNVVLALLLITYRIRNNLFHGEKEVISLHSQTKLFQVVNSLLATYLKVTKNA